MVKQKCLVCQQSFTGQGGTCSPACEAEWQEQEERRRVRKTRTQNKRKSRTHRWREDDYSGRT